MVPNPVPGEPVPAPAFACGPSIIADSGMMTADAELETVNANAMASVVLTRFILIPFPLGLGQTQDLHAPPEPARAGRGRPGGRRIHRRRLPCPIS